MAGGSSVALLRDIQTLFDTGSASGFTDRQLLDRFTARRDAAAEAAFEMLVLRHGPMVLRVCQNVLRDTNDAHDAFQATFLVLVSRSGSIRKLDSLGGWLYGVACRVAARARVETARRRSAEQRAALRVVEAVEPTDRDHADHAAFGPIVQEEVRRLPEKYRAVVVLCYWQGLTQEQAAVQLGCPLGTVRSRMARARNLLRRRLSRRGLAPLAGVVAAGLDGGPASASLLAWPPPHLAYELVQSTIQVSFRVAAGEPAGRFVSVAAASLARGVLWSMAMIKLKTGLVAIVLVGLVGSGAWFGALDGAHARAQLKTLPKPAPPAKNIKAGVSGNGYCLFPGQNTVISFVEDGSMVKKGDVVCELDSSALADQLVDQQIALLLAKASHDIAKLDRETAEIAVVEYEEGIFKDQDLETEGNIKIAEAELTFAQDQLVAAKAKMNGDPLEIKRAELARLRARFALEKAQSRKKALVDFTKGKTIKELKATVQKYRSDELAKKAIWELALSKAKKLERAISACRILAPIDGRVEQLVAEGATVQKGQMLFRVDPTPAANPGAP